MSENLDDAAMRVLKEKTNVDNIYLEQLYTFGDPLRHPVARVITCAYFALIRAEDVNVSTDENVQWHRIDDLPALYCPAKTRRIPSDLSSRSCIPVSEVASACRALSFSSDILLV